jgi:hypothetical protein
MLTVITVKTYTQATVGDPCAWSELSTFMTDSLYDAIFTHFSQIDDTTLRVFLSELNRYGSATLQSAAFLVKISYTGAFPDKDW